MSANPVVVEVTRGGWIESRHRGAVCVVDSLGARICGVGDIAASVFVRSAIKPLQALPLVESGAADRFALSAEELAVACASHAGESRHVEVVGAWLDRLGLTPACLVCGPHVPFDAATAERLVREGRSPSPLHNNCSGKHTGFISTALHLGVPLEGYAALTHPVQQRVRRTLAEVIGYAAESLVTGIDGCGVPTFALPLAALACAFAKLAAPDGLATERADAIRRITAAMATHPQLIGGTGRFDSRVIEASHGRVLSKGGAEGVAAAALLDQGLGIALKIDDGGKRAVEAAMAALLLRYAQPHSTFAGLLADSARAPLRNTRGEEVGEVRVAPLLASGTL